MTDPILNLPVSQEIAKMRRRLLDDPRPIDPIEMARWLRALMEKHWAELGRARIAAMALRNNVVALEDARPCDVEAR